MAAAKVVFVAAFLAYPVLVYFGLLYFEARFVALILIVAVAARLVFAKRRGGPIKLALQLLGLGAQRARLGQTVRHP